MIVDIAGARRDRNGGLAPLGTGRNLPVHDLKPRLSLGYAVHQHILRRQAAMVQALAVSMAKRLGQLAEKPQTRFRRQIDSFSRRKRSSLIELGSCSNTSAGPSSVSRKSSTLRIPG